MKENTRLKKLIQLFILMAAIGGLLCACVHSSEDSPMDAYKTTHTSEQVQETVPLEGTGIEGTTEAIETTEPEIYMIGEYTLSAAKDAGGVFIAYEDGSFDILPTGGYMTDEGGMYLANSIRDRLPEFNANSKLVVFSDVSYSVATYKVNQKIPAIYMSDWGTAHAYGRLSQGKTDIYVESLNNGYETLPVDYINGEPAQEYEAVVIDWVVHPYKGMTSQEERYNLVGFQEGTEVCLGFVDGTSIVEKTYNANCTYYDWHPMHNNYDESDGYELSAKATYDGYAVIDLSEVETGEYVLRITCYGDDSRYYYATFLKWVAE